MATLKNKQTAKKAQMKIDAGRLNELMGICHTSYQEIRQENKKLKEENKKLDEQVTNLHFENEDLCDNCSRLEEENEKLKNLVKLEPRSIADAYINGYCEKVLDKEPRSKLYERHYFTNRLLEEKDEEIKKLKEALKQVRRDLSPPR